MGGSTVSNDVLVRLHPLEVRVLPHLKSKSLSALAKKAKLSEVEAMRALQWLENKGAVKLKKVVTKQILLDKNAKKAIKDGMPEMRFLHAVQKGASTQQTIMQKANLTPPEYGVSVGLLKKRAIIDMKKGKIVPTAQGKKIDTDKSAEMSFLKRIVKDTKFTERDKPLIEALKSRKAYLIIKETKDRIITLTELGKRLSEVNIKNINFSERVTKEDLESGAWKNKKYRAYDVTINVPQIQTGKIHFVQEAIDYIRRIWIEMGFEEMTGDYIHTAFWDLDVLFVPQDHPARELQDTFYLENPASAKITDKQLYEKVRDVHETGGNTGSKGWQYPYSKEEAERLMLRTHTTVLSAETLNRLRKEKLPLQGKFFTVGKVFRNEKLDWKHLFEFTQVEGIVVGKDVNLAQHIGYMKTFFAKMGFPKIRCRPSHFPYTEPSVEIDVWHPKKKQWIELGGSGIFRPEVTKTLLGVEVPVLAWGLGLERIIVDFFGLEDLRDLYKNDIKQMQHMKRFLKLEEKHG